MILSGDPPRGRVLATLIAAIVLALAFAPFLFPGAKPLNVAEKICVYAALVASYDLLLGYAGIVSFAHVMFFGVGSYAVAITLAALGPSWIAVGIGFVAALPVAIALALAIGFVSLRVQTIFFAMTTLAFASAFSVLASQMSWLTGGEDGKSFQVPEALRPSFRPFESDILGVAITGKTLSYYLVFIGCAALFLLLLRIVNAPFGRVLLAIRENPARAEALGYRIVFHRTFATCIAAAVAAIAGALHAVWLHYTGPDTALSFSIMIDILVIVVIGGMGSLYGAIVGAALFVIAENYLQALMGGLAAAASSAAVPILPGFLNPDRWLLWLGILFILAVYFAPRGIVGRLREG
jgi:branched-chain amino acid transport system permease protein